ncbi:MAG: hypothetical protein QOF00_1781 [Pseudonocardiales bacterium]|jgi:hypothetical protein|nr:hypothetical protein [Pseudonocardiales bacterium]
MTTTAPRTRLSPASAVCAIVVAGLLMSLVVLCCCTGEAAGGATERGGASLAATSTPSVHAAVIDARTVGTGSTTAGHASRTPGGRGDVTGDGAGSADHGCRHPAAIVTASPLFSRDLAVATVPRLPSGHAAAAGSADATGRPAARAPAPHLLCVMRT